jgi:hypothetical protein
MTPEIAGMPIGDEGAKSQNIGVGIGIGIGIA